MSIYDINTIDSEVLKGYIEETLEAALNLGQRFSVSPGISVGEYRYEDFKDEKDDDNPFSSDKTVLNTVVSKILEDLKNDIDNGDSIKEDPKEALDIPDELTFGFAYDSSDESKILYNTNNIYVEFIKEGTTPSDNIISCICEGDAENDVINKTVEYIYSIDWTKNDLDKITVTRINTIPYISADNRWVINDKKTDIIASPEVSINSNVILLRNDASGCTAIDDKYSVLTEMQAVTSNGIKLPDITNAEGLDESERKLLNEALYIVFINANDDIHKDVKPVLFIRNNDDYVLLTNEKVKGSTDEDKDKPFDISDMIDIESIVSKAISNTTHLECDSKLFSHLVFDNAHKDEKNTENGTGKTVYPVLANVMGNEETDSMYNFKLYYADDVTIDPAEGVTAVSNTNETKFFDPASPNMSETPLLDLSEVIVNRQTALNRINIINATTDGTYQAYIGVNPDSTIEDSTIHIGGSSSNDDMGNDTLLVTGKNEAFMSFDTLSIDTDNTKINGTTYLAGTTYFNGNISIESKYAYTYTIVEGTKYYTMIHTPIGRYADIDESYMIYESTGNSKPKPNVSKIGNSLFIAVKVKAKNWNGSTVNAVDQYVSDGINIKTLFEQLGFDYNANFELTSNNCNVIIKNNKPVVLHINSTNTPDSIICGSPLSITWYQSGNKTVYTINELLTEHNMVALSGNFDTTAI